MNAIEFTNIKEALPRVRPTTVRVFRGGEIVRDIKVPTGRTRWAAVVKELERIDAERVEMLNRQGELLMAIDSEAAAHDDGQDRPSSRDRRDPGEGQIASMLRVLVEGQRAVLSNRSDESKLALQACIQAVQMLTGVLGVMAQVHHQALATQAETYQMAIQAAQEAGMAGEGEGGLMSEQMLTAMAPMLMQKFFGMRPTKAIPGPSAKSNGVKGGSDDAKE